MIDAKKTIDLIKGGLLEPRGTWQSYHSENRGWQDTALLLTLPLILASFVLAGLLALIFSSYSMFGAGMGLGGWLLGLIMAVIALAAAAFIFSTLAGLFKGKHDFNRGIAAMSLAAIPGYIGNVLAPVPFIGWLISLALGIVSLVFLYQIIPLYLEVPDEKRVLHYVASLVATFIVMLILGTVFGTGHMMSRYQGVSATQPAPVQAGVVGSIQRHARFMEEAEQQRYDPPSHGRISEAQMDRYLQVLHKAARVRDEELARFESLKQKYEGKEPDLSDLGAVSGGIGSVLGVFNAEMEVVLTGGGNWAEHQWVGEQLRVARIQQDVNEAVKHNYALYRARDAEFEKLAAIP